MADKEDVANKEGIVAKFGIRNLKTESNSNGWELRWDPNYQTATAPILILAVGFGTEKELPPADTTSYWRDNQLDQDDEDSDERRAYLISGTGDGGLTDLLRATINDFRHDTLVSDFLLDRPNVASLKAKLLNIEEAARRAANPASVEPLLMTGYRDLNDLSEPIDKLLQHRLRTDRRVALNGPGEPLTLRASVLNRYLTSRLIFNDHVIYHKGRLDAATVLRSGRKLSVTLQGKVFEFDKVVIRHGTSPALEALDSKMWAASETLKHRNELDQSRRPLAGWYQTSWFHKDCREPKQTSRQPAPKRALANVTPPPPPSRSDSDRVGNALSDFELARDFRLATDEDLCVCARFFKFICQTGSTSIGPAEVLQFLDETPSDSICEVRLIGDQGAGKSTLLAALWKFLERRHGVKPHMMHVDAAELVGAAVAEKRRPFRKIEAWLEANPDDKLILIVDCLSSRLIEESTYVCAELLQSVPLNNIAGIFWGVGGGFERDLERIIANQCGGAWPARTMVVDFSPINLDNPKLREFLQYYIWVHDRLRGGEIAFDDINVDRLEARIADLVTEKYLDLHLLSIICERLDSPNYGTINKLADFLQAYCVERLQAPGVSRSADQALLGAAQLAHRLVARAFFSDGSAMPTLFKITPDQRRGLVWELATGHANIRDFLCAWYICFQLRQCARDNVSRALKTEALNFDYPKVINRFLVSIVKALPEREAKRFFEGCNTALRRLVSSDAPSFEARNLIYYLQARTDSKAAHRLNEALRKIELALADSLNLPYEKRLALKTERRTLSVSLILLDQAEPGWRYLRALLNCPEDASIDRGYHQLYYGDRQIAKNRNAEQYLDSPHGGWEESFNVLKVKLEDGMGLNRDNAEAFDELERLEMQHCLFTIVSFVQSRIGTSGVSLEQLAFVRRVLDRALESEGKLFEDLRDYLRMMRIDLDRRDASKWRFIFDLYKLKWEPRRGWLVRNVEPLFFGGRIESVSDHSYFAIVLANILLPERFDALPGYRKQRVVELIMFHDIGEALTGDFAPSDSQGLQVRKQLLEESSMRYIRFKETYSELQGTAQIYENWRLFSSARILPTVTTGLNEDQVNAAVARDIDRLENLVQLMVYRQLKPDALDDATYEKFTNALSTALSSLGQSLVNSLLMWEADKLATATQWPKSFRDDQLLAKEGNVVWGAQRD